MDGESISLAATESMTEYSIIGDILEDVTDSDLEIEFFMKEPDSMIEEFMASASYAED